MTVKEKLEGMLIQNGMFESQAKEVMELSIPELNTLLGDYKITFNTLASEYPNVIYDILFLSIKPIALKWIEANKPEAWFKPMFL